MLVMMTAEQVNCLWPLIRTVIHEVLPPPMVPGPMQDVNIQKSLLVGQMQCWLAYEQKPEEPTGLALTTVTEDAVSGTRNLLVYALSSFRTGRLSAELMEDGMQTLLAYAEAKQCHRLVGYTSSRSIVERFRAFGGSAEQMFLTYQTGVRHTRLVDDKETDQ